MAIASNVALALLLSLFPFLMLIAGLVQWWGSPELAGDVVNLIFNHWPEDAAKPIADQVKIIIGQSPGEIFSLGTLVALVLATNGVESARDGLNRAYKVPETRSFLKRRLQGAVFVLAGAVGLIAAALILVGTPLIWTFLLISMPWLKQFAFTITLAQYGLALVLLWLSLFFFHYFLPDGHRNIRQLFWGILISIVGILAGSKLFAIYLHSFADYTALYAGLAGIMTAIIYLYCLAVLILYGAEFNAALME